LSTVIDVPITGGVGERNETPFTVNDLHREYHLGIGELQLDLTHVDLVRGRTYDIRATVGVGHVLVRLPRDVVAELHGHAGLGAVQFLDEHDGGVDVARDKTLTSAGENPTRIVLDLEVGIGQVEVQDAAA
jgi:predicted membrane protein